MGKLISHTDYFQSKSSDNQRLLNNIRDVVLSTYPDAHECISYNIPAFRTTKSGKIFIYFAAFQNHIGIYPPIKHDGDLIKDIMPYRGPKGNLSFLLSEPLPMPIITRVVKTLYQEYK